MGIERFEQWQKLIPANNIVVGLDEHSGIIMDCEKNQCEVHGVSSVTVLKDGGAQIHAAGASFSLSELGNCTPPDPIENGIRSEVWQMLQRTPLSVGDDPSEEVLQLLEARKEARSKKDFAESDRLRDAISALGWTVQDSKDGQTLVRK
jgi:hypothetical protein